MLKNRFPDAHTILVLSPTFRRLVIPQTTSLSVVLGFLQENMM
jgi:hypothetical protein